MDEEELRTFAEQYTSAWNSRNPEKVASLFEEGGSLSLDGRSESVGRDAITEAVQERMTAIPDLKVEMKNLETGPNRAVYHWELSGTDSGPHGTGNPVHTSGREEWSLSADNRIARAASTTT
jgi:uncharacterized protein (TIGR02246 family)